MARIPAINRLVQEDFKDQPWIGKLLQPLNSFMTEVIAALNKSLTLSENLAAMVTVQRVKSGSPISFTPVTFTSTIGRPVGVYVVQCVDVSNAQVMTVPVSASWSYNPGNNLISIDYVSGLWTTAFMTYNSDQNGIVILDGKGIQVGHTIVSASVPAGTKVKSITSYGPPAIIEMTDLATTSDTELSEFTGKTYDITLVVLGG